jgi:multidrug efflux system membrane fusion protein
MNLRVKQVAAVAGVLVVGLLVWRVGFSGGGKANLACSAVPVTAVKVVTRDVPSYRGGIGTIQAYNTVTVRSRVDGELTQVAFQEGQDVKKGDVLARIDARAYEAALHNAQGTLAKDESALANAKRDLARYTSTAAKGYTSVQQLDTQTANVTTLAAAVQADQASVENARVQLSYTTITAPNDGRTGIRAVDQGNIVHATDTNGLVVITQVQPISAVFTLPQDQLPEVAAAQNQGPLDVTAYSRDGATAFDNGKLQLIDNQIDPATGTVRLKVTFPNAERKLWPGQFVNLRLRVGTAHDGVALPARVVQRSDKGAFVYVIKADNTVEPRPVEIGREDRGQVMIVKGLASGENVVVDGQMRLQSGTKVAAQPADITGDQGGEGN